MHSVARRILPLVAVSGISFAFSRKAFAATATGDDDLLRVPETSSRNSKLVSCGALTHALRPIELKFDGVPKHVALGARFAAVVDQSDRVAIIVPASKSAGLLSAPSVLGPQSTRIELPVLQKLRPVHIACSDASLFIISASGHLHEVHIPKQLDSATAPSDFSISQIHDLGRWHTPVKVVAGSDHVVVLTSSGEVFSRGSNEFGQLGQLTGDPAAAAVHPVESSAQFARVHTSTQQVQTAHLIRAAQNRQTLRIVELTGGGGNRSTATAASTPSAVQTRNAGTATPPGSAPVGLLDRLGSWAVQANESALQREQAAMQQVTRALQDSMRTSEAHLTMTADEEIAEPLPPARDDPVVDIAAGAHHTVLVTRSGRVYTCGLDTHMQCAQGRPWVTGLQTRVFPTLVQPLREIRALACVAGEAHTAVLARIDVPRDSHSTSNQSGNNDSSSSTRTAVIVWGRGDRGQLGHEATNVHVAPPRVVDALHGLKQFDESSSTVKPLNVVQLAAGTNHTMALLQDGTVFSWGVGGAGQCGHGTRANIREPRMLRHSASVNTSVPATGINVAGTPGNVGNMPPIRARCVYAGGDSSAIVL